MRIGWARARANSPNKANLPPADAFTHARFDALTAQAVLPNKPNSAFPGRKGACASIKARRFGQTKPIRGQNRSRAGSREGLGYATAGRLRHGSRKQSQFARLRPARHVSRGEGANAGGREGAEQTQFVTTNVRFRARTLPRRRQTRQAKPISGEGGVAGRIGRRQAVGRAGGSIP